MRASFLAISIIACVTVTSAIDLISPAIRKGVLKGPYSLLVSAALSKDSLIRLKLICDNSCSNKDITYSLFLRKCLCANEFGYMENAPYDIFERPFACNIREECSRPVSYSLVSEHAAKCPQISTDAMKLAMEPSDFTVTTIQNASDATSKKTTFSQTIEMDDQQTKLGYPVARAWENGFYVFAFRAKGCESMEYTLSMKGPDGYLLLDEVPFLKFYKAMSWYYGLLGAVWFAFCIKYRKELMRIQYFIGLVILMCYVELLVYTAAYRKFNFTAGPVDRLLSAALVLSAARRALSRGLLILVSYGYGIVKPRMGTIYRKVTALTLSYFVAALLENFHLTAMAPEQVHLRSVYILLPVAVLDSLVTVWILTSLKATLRVLRIKRNEVKIRLYLRFMTCLVFVTLASYIFWLTVVVQAKSVKCLKSVRQSWVENTVWWTISTFLLTAITVLWRPSDNNKRYAYTPLLDKDDDSDVEEVKSDVDLDDGEHIRLRSAQFDQQNKSSSTAKEVPQIPKMSAAEQLLTSIDFEQKADRLMDQLNKLS